MAVLESGCYLCDQPIVTPVPADGHAFCCHGCRELWRLLGDEEIAQLKSQPGVQWAQLRQQIAQPEPAKLTLGAKPESLALAIDGMWCASCAILIEQVVLRTPGVMGVHIDYTSSTADVAMDGAVTSAEHLTRVIRDLGYGASLQDEADNGGESRDQTLIKRFGLSLALSLFVMMFSVPVWSGYLPELPPVFRDWLGYGLMTLATPVLFWGGWPFLRGAWTSLRHRIPTMDLLIAIGTLSAYGYSIAALLLHQRYLYFDTASMLITFLLFSKLLEVSTRNRAGGITRLLSRFTVGQARRLDSAGNVEMVAIDAVAPEDRLVLLPGERVAVDAVIDEGLSALDESLLTGEAMPVDKGVGDVVYAGTLNHTGRLVVRALRPQRESLVSQIQGYVKEAQDARGPWRTMADRVLKVFVPFVLLFGLGTLVTSHWGFHLVWSQALLRMTAVFVIACPCALSVATPLAIMAGAQRIGRNGVLLKSGDALERLAEIDVIAFDKTGTLTTGRMTVRDYWPQDPEVMMWAASAELGSEHPIAQALVRYAENHDIALLSGSEFEASPGFGIRAHIEGRSVQVLRADDALVAGDERLAQRVDAWRQSGFTVSAVVVDGHTLGAVAVADTLRAGTLETIQRLKAENIELAILSGDHPDALARVAGELDIEQAMGRLEPLHKAEWIAAQQTAQHRVLFVGDGINDSPALVRAELGMAMAGASDIAREAGHLTLTRPSIEGVVEAIAAGRMASRVIRQNLIWAFLYNILALPAAALGVTSPLIAAAAMLLSSAFVLGNSLRVLEWSPRRYVLGLAAVTVVGGLLFSLAWLGI